MNSICWGRVALNSPTLVVIGDIKTTKEPFFDIPVNSKIIQIGDGRETGTYRTDKFIKPVTYVGSLVVKKQGIKFYAFKLPEDLTNSTEDVYVLYQSTGLEPMRSLANTTRFYKPVFLYENNKD